MDFLAGLRSARRGPALEDGKESFTAAEVKALLGVQLASVHRMVKGGQLTCEGTGRKKRFPRPAVEAILRERLRGISAETSNHYLTAVKGFTRWLKGNNRDAPRPA